MSTKLNINAIENGTIPYEKLNNDIIEKINSKSDKTHTHDYLPLSGGTMSGNVDMGGNEIKNTNFELVESLPTENLYEGRQVTYEGKIYTYHNEKWLNVADDLGGKPETHEENFVYQPTAADLSIKDGFADIKKLKGNTVVWNQLIQNGNYEYSTDGLSFKYYNLSVSIKGTLTSTFNITLPIVHDTFNIIKSHKYLLKVSKEMPDGFYIAFNDSSEGSIYKNLTKSKKIVQALYDESKNTIYIVGQATEQVANTIYDYEGYLNIIDLTNMFGEGNEPATVEEFEAMFPNDYYEYNEGELLSFDGKGLKSVGFNQWDEEWELGAYDVNNGNKVQQDTHLRNVNPIKVLGDTDYYFKSPVTLFLCWYDSEMKFINLDIEKYSVKNSIIKSPSNAAYLNFYQYNKNTYDNDICINLSHTGYRNGEYEPYEDYKLQFQDGKTISQLTGKLNGEGESVTIFPDGLRSAGTVYDEIIYDKTTGKYKAVKRIGSVDMGTLSWSGNNSNITGWWAEFTKMAERTANQVPNIITKKYITRHSYNVAAVKDKTISTALRTDTYNRHIVILDLDYTNPEDAALFKQSLSGQILYYELAEPEVYELDFPINTSYEAYDFGTEEVLYNDDKEVNIPMKASIEYGFNAVDMIRGNYFEVDKIKKGLNEINFLITDLDVRTNDIKSNIESNELVIASAITNLEERIKELEKKINQLLTNN